MPKKANFYGDRECTKKCLSVQHANEMISAITMPTSCVTDRQLASYFKSKCGNFAELRDNYGRTLLHAAASCGRRDLCLFLLKMHAQNINLADSESGYTALHRSIAFGFINVAVALMQMNANLHLKDKEDLNPFDIVRRNVNSKHVEPAKCILRRTWDYDQFISSSDQKLSKLSRECYYDFATEVYTWGTNSNYTSGFGSASGKSQPEFLEFFEKKNEIIEQVCMQKYHTLFVSMSGNVWGCGIGQGGRLGRPSEDIVIIPEIVSLRAPPAARDLFCNMAAAGQDHSIFLCDGCKVFVCGTNLYHQLGISPPPAFVIKPVPVEIDLAGQIILGVAASDFHSVFWTDSAVYTCGLHAGQLGHSYSEDATIPTFRKVPCFHRISGSISNVAVSRAVTIVAIYHYIHVLTAYTSFKIDLVYILRGIEEKEMERPNRKYQTVNIQNFLYDYPTRRDILKLTAIGGELASKKVKPFFLSPSTAELRIAMVLRDGSLYLWQKKMERFLRCYFLTKDDILVTDVILNAGGMMISTRKGEIFKAKPLGIMEFPLHVDHDFTFTANYAIFHKAMSDCYILQIEKIECVFRAIAIFSDPKGDNFAILQRRSIGALTPVLVSSKSSLKTDLTQFYHETDDSDVFHDIVFRVKHKLFAAHKYILATYSKKFLELEENNSTIVIEDVSPEVFEIILEFVYTGSLRIRMASYQSKENQNRNSSKSLPSLETLFKKILQATETFKIDSLKNFLEEFKTDGFTSGINPDCAVDKEVISFPVFDRCKFPSLYDIKLKSQDGNVFHAHKCILVARVPYFKNMLSGNWIESTNVDQEFNIPVTSSLLSEFLEFVYTDNVSKRANKRDIQFWTSLLMLADQFMLMKLKELAENAISERLHVRNVVDTLIFASLMNSHKLKEACFRFICINLPSVLYFRYLEKLDEILLDELTEFYRDHHFSEFRNFSAYSDVCNVDEIFAAEQRDSGDWDLILDSNFEADKNITNAEETKQQKKPKKVRKPALAENNRSASGESKSDFKVEKIHNHELSKRIPAVEEEKSTVADHHFPEGEWIAIHRQIKSIKSLLKANAAAKECPQLIEQKENYTPLKLKQSPSSAGPLTEPELDAITDDLTYSIDFTKLTPKMSQAERKRQRKLSESSKGNVNLSPTENSDKDKPFTQLEIDSTSPSSTSTSCWRSLEQTLNDSTSLSSIMAFEKNQKKSIIKETRKLVTKSLQSTQIEEQAIQELMTFYNVRSVDDEHITVQRVIHSISSPQWVTKKGSAQSEI